MAKNKRYDVEAIGRAFRAGLFPSKQALAQAFDCSPAAIRKWELKFGWQRDPKKEFEMATRVAVERTGREGLTEPELILSVAQERAGVVLASRRRLAKLGKLVERLYRDVEGLDRAADPDKKETEADLIAARAGLAKVISIVENRLTALEAKVFSLDYADGKPGEGEENPEVCEEIREKLDSIYGAGC